MGRGAIPGMAREIAKAYDPQLVEGRPFPRRPRLAWRSFLHRYSAAERDRFAAYRPHARPYGNRHSDALASHARLQHAVPPGHRPRWNFHAARSGEAIGRTRD